MRTIQVKVSERDFQRYGLGEDNELRFSDLVERISLEQARKALLECNEIARATGLSEMTMEEIDAEIKAVRNAKGHS
jgi:hypothetical protein